jgi:hypothetical protein
MKSELREFFNKEIDKIKNEMVRLPINERADILRKIHPILIQESKYREQSYLNEWGLPKGKIIAYCGEESGFSGIDSDEYGWIVKNKEE